jgi:hypothetical protein
MRWIAWLSLAFLSCGLIAWPGKACRKHEECDGLPDGYCSRAEICTRECSESKACPEKSTCTTVGRRTVCLPSCDSEDDCLSNFTCSNNVCQVEAPLDPPPMQ